MRLSRAYSSALRPLWAVHVQPAGLVLGSVGAKSAAVTMLAYCGYLPPDSRFVVHRDAARLWRWRLHAGDARLLLQSEGYVEKSDCVAAAHDFRETIKLAAIVEDTPSYLRVVGPV